MIILEHKYMSIVSNNTIFVVIAVYMHIDL